MSLSDFHLTALEAAYALMQAAHDTGKPHACWAHHRSVGGARTADQLVDRGLFQRRLDAAPGDIETYRYRITRAGSHALGRLHLIEDLPLNEDNDMTEQPDPLADLRFTAKPVPATPAPEVENKATSDLPWSKPCPTCSGTLHLATDSSGRFYECNGCAYTEDADDVPFVLGVPPADSSPDKHTDSAPLSSPVPTADSSPDKPSAPTLPDTSDTIRRMLHTLSAPQLVMLFQVADVVAIAPRDLQSRHMLIERGLIAIVGSPHDWTHVLTLTGKQVVELSKTEPATSHPILTTPPADRPATLIDEIHDLRLDREALINSAIKLEARVKDAEIARETYKRELDAALDALKSIAALLADSDGVVPDDVEAAARSLKLHLADTEQHAANLKENAAGLAETVAAQKAELDALKTDKRSLELALAAQAGAESQVECDFVFGITPHDLRARWLAGWAVEHYSMTAGKVDVVLRRAGKPARKSRTRSGNTGKHIPAVTRPIGVPPARTPQPAAQVLTGDAFIMPGDDPQPPHKPGFLGDTPTDPFWRGKQPHAIKDAPRAPRTPPSSAPSPLANVMDSFTRNLQQTLEANPIPQYSSRPTA